MHLGFGEFGHVFIFKEAGYHFLKLCKFFIIMFSLNLRISLCLQSNGAFSKSLDPPDNAKATNDIIPVLNAWPSIFTCSHDFWALDEPI